MKKHSGNIIAVEVRKAFSKAESKKERDTKQNKSDHSMKRQRDLKLDTETIQVILSSMKEWKKPEWTRILFQLHNKNCDDEICIIKSIREANIAT